LRAKNAKDAMNYLSKNFSDLRGKTPKVSDFMKKESIKESRTKIVEAIKAKADGHAQDIAGIEGEVERITQLANYQS
jgi:predicted transcriptional regulator